MTEQVARTAAALAAAATGAQPRVAVVIPCFNDGAFLPDALGSLVEQEPLEVVVVDDGSTDEHTLAVLRAVDEAGVKVVRQANAGLAAARMTGVRETASPFVHPLDADDLLPPGVVTVLADAMEDERLSAAWGDIQSFGARSCFYPRARHIDPWRLTFVSEITGTVLMRRSSLEAIGGWELRSAYEDYDLWLKAAEAGWIGVHIGQVSLWYREHDAARLSSSGLARHHDLLSTLVDRHRDLFAQRHRIRRASPSPPAIKLLFTLAHAIPGLRWDRRQQLVVLARHYVQREMSPDCFMGVGARLRRRLRGGRG
jgi:glycosyltransferase involved in cell wall biosynthesis